MNIEDPIRSIVAPSWIAMLKSLLIPIDNSLRFIEGNSFVKWLRSRLSRANVDLMADSFFVLGAIVISPFVCIFGSAIICSMVSSMVLYWVESKLSVGATRPDLDCSPDVLHCIRIGILIDSSDALFDSRFASFNECTE